MNPCPDPSSKDPAPHTNQQHLPRAWNPRLIFLRGRDIAETRHTSWSECHAESNGSRWSPLSGSPLWGLAGRSSLTTDDEEDTELHRKKCTNSGHSQQRKTWRVSPFFCLAQFMSVFAFNCTRIFRVAVAAAVGRWLKLYLLASRWWAGVGVEEE